MNSSGKLVGNFLVTFTGFSTNTGFTFSVAVTSPTVTTNSTISLNSGDNLMATQLWSYRETTPTVIAAADSNVIYSVKALSGSENKFYFFERQLQWNEGVSFIHALIESLLFN